MQCGVGNADEAKFCISCGEKLVTALSPSSSSTPWIGATAAAPAPAPAVLAPTDSAQAMPISDSELRNFRGVGGWLLFFCIALLIVQPAANFIEAAGDPVALVMAFLLSGLSMTTSIMLILEKRSAFGWLWWYFALYAVLMVLGLVGAIFAATGAREAGPAAGEAAIKDIFSMIRGIGFVILWVSYFKRSQRVLATFGRNLW
jgi:hypothetical protein